MKSCFLSITLLIFYGQLFSQELTKDSLTGTWKVISSQVLSDNEMKLDAEGAKKMESFRKGFIGSKFIFGSDSKFKLTFQPESPAMLKEIFTINNKSWDIAKDIIRIGGKENIMKIIVKKIENKTFFLLDESPFFLEVIKL